MHSRILKPEIVIIDNPRTSIESAYGYWLAAITLLIASLSFGAVTSVAVLLKPIAKEWSLGSGDVALIHCSTMIGAGVGSLLIGRVHDRFGFFWIALLSSVSTAVGLVIAAFATSTLTLHLSYGVLIGGLGQGAFFGPLAAAISQWFDRRRALAISIAASGQSVGGLLLPPLLRWGAEVYGWRNTVFVYGICAGVTLFACAFVFRRTPPSPRSANGADLSERNPLAPLDFWKLGLSMAMLNIATFVGIGHLTAYGEELGLRPTTAASVVSVMLGITLLSRLSLGKFSLKFGTYRALVTMAVLHVSGVILLSVSSNLFWVFASVTLIGLGFGGYVPAYAVLVREHFPASQSGRRISEIYFFAFLAAGAGSWLGGVTRDISGGYGFSFGVAACTSLMGNLILISLLSRFKRI